MLHSLAIRNFRNIDSLELTLAPGCNALIGPNGQGKTNILEAVYYLALLRSFRTTRINDLKQWQHDVFRLQGCCQYAPNLPQTELDVTYGTDRRLALDGLPVYRTSEFINRFLCVTFIPQDLDLIQGPETLRRRFMDIALSQLSPAYLRNLQAYQEALKSRNALLKDHQSFQRQVLLAYDDVLVQKGVLIEQERQRFISRLNQTLIQQSGQLIEDGRKLTAAYLSGIGHLLQSDTDLLEADTLAQRFHDTLDKQFERDCRDGYTHCGPHRAGMACLLNDTSLVHFGSAGECRMASLALKFACLHVIRQQFPAADVTLLIDDVIGELDARRQLNFFSLLHSHGQILFAGTFLPDALPHCDAIFHLAGGRILPTP